MAYHSTANTSQPRRSKTILSPDGPTARFLYTILKQLDLRSIDWNTVASELDITNGHAARMRYSRFKLQIEDLYKDLRPFKSKPPTMKRGGDKSKNRDTRKKSMAENDYDDDVGTVKREVRSLDQEADQASHTATKRLKLEDGSTAPVKTENKRAGMVLHQLQISKDYDARAAALNKQNQAVQQPQKNDETVHPRMLQYSRSSTSAVYRPIPAQQMANASFNTQQRAPPRQYHPLSPYNPVNQQAANYGQQSTYHTTGGPSYITPGGPSYMGHLTQPQSVYQPPAQPYYQPYRNFAGHTSGTVASNMQQMQPSSVARPAVLPQAGFSQPTMGLNAPQSEQPGISSAATYPYTPQLFSSIEPDTPNTDLLPTGVSSGTALVFSPVPTAAVLNAAAMAGRRQPTASTSGTALPDVSYEFALNSLDIPELEKWIADGEGLDLDGHGAVTTVTESPADMPPTLDVGDVPGRVQASFIREETTSDATKQVTGSTEHHAAPVTNNELSSTAEVVVIDLDADVKASDVKIEP